MAKNWAVLLHCVAIHLLVFFWRFNVSFDNLLLIDCYAVAPNEETVGIQETLKPAIKSMHLTVDNENSRLLVSEEISHPSLNL